jgi:hypothetical protein
MPQATPEQLAKMTPEQKNKYEQTRRLQAPSSLSVEDMNALKSINMEEQRAVMAEPMQDLSLSPEERNEIASKIQKTVQDMRKIGQLLPKWYAITHDDGRLRMFFRTVSALTCLNR